MRFRLFAIRLVLAVVALAGVALMLGSTLALAVPATVNPAVTKTHLLTILIVGVALVAGSFWLDRTIEGRVLTQWAGWVLGLWVWLEACLLLATRFPVFNIVFWVTTIVSPFLLSAYDQRRTGKTYSLWRFIKWVVIVYGAAALAVVVAALIVERFGLRRQFAR
jgi:hypothetical protein